MMKKMSPLSSRKWPLESLLTALQDNKADPAYCSWPSVGLQGTRRVPFPPYYEGQNKAGQPLRAASPWPIHAALLRWQVVDEAGGFQAYLPSCMDYDFWLRMGLFPPPPDCPRAWVMAFYRHQREGQIISKQWRQTQNTWTVKMTFVQQFLNLVAGLGRNTPRSLIDGGLLRRGYDNYWRRDLVSAWHIIRLVLRTGAWKARDHRYLLPARLPEKLYLALIGLAERSKTQHG